MSNENIYIVAYYRIAIGCMCLLIIIGSILHCYKYAILPVAQMFTCLVLFLPLALFYLGYTLLNVFRNRTISKKEYRGLVVNNIINTFNIHDAFNYGRNLVVVKFKKTTVTALCDQRLFVNTTCYCKKVGDKFVVTRIMPPAPPKESYVR